MKHVITLSIWLMTFVIGGALFWTSNEVQLAEQENAELVGQILEHEDHIAILNAEWHYLNSPAYLDRLTQVAFNGNEKGELLMLADSADLPEMEIVMLPVRKPEIPESFKKSAPIVVAEAKKVQSVKTSQPARNIPAARPQKDKNFSMVLASWTE